MPRIPMFRAFPLLALGALPLGLAAQARPGDPVLVQSSRVDVVIGAALARDPEEDRARFAKLITGCRRTMSFAPVDSAAVVNAAPPAFEVREASGPSAVIVSVLHSEGLQANCGDDRLQSTVLAAAGLRITYDTSYSPDRDVTRVVLRRGDAEIIPIDLRREVVRRLGPAGFQAPRTSWIRLAIDLSQLSPRADGHLDDLTLEVHFASGGEPERMPIPWSAVRPAWEAMLEARTITNATGTAPVALPEPGDELLHQAFEAYQRNDLVTAARLGARRVGSPQLKPIDRVRGRLQLGFAFVGLGDTAAARVVLGRAVEEEPCLQLDPSAPAGARELVAALRRPPARCRAQSVPYTVLKSALLPGLGRPTSHGDQPVRVGIAALVVTLVSGAVYSGVQANSEYDKYLAYQVRPDLQTVGGTASDFFRSAESARVRGRTLWAVAGLVWGGQLVMTTRAEYQLARRLESIGTIGRDPRTRSVGVAPLIGPRDVGLALSFQW